MRLIGCITSSGKNIVINIDCIVCIEDFSEYEVKISLLGGITYIVQQKYEMFIMSIHDIIEKS